jgi:hypothetical protein
MHHIYDSYKSLHRWQVDIKYLTDIPNYLSIWLHHIYLYEITFRDFKSWLTLVFYWNNKDRTSVYIALRIFMNLLTLIWINIKDVFLQFDWWAEFSNIKIGWHKWQLIEFIEKYFKWYRIIDRKEQNWHVEAFHRLVEEWPIWYKVYLWS